MVPIKKSINVVEWEGIDFRFHLGLDKSSSVDEKSSQWKSMARRHKLVNKGIG